MVRRATSRLAAPLAFGLAVALGGCPPGSLEDPERFRDAGAAPSCDSFDVEKDFFQQKCVDGCHDGTSAQTTLNLSKLGVGSTLVGKNAAEPGCESRLLIDPADPDKSYLLEKLVSPTPQCGEQMPNSSDEATAAEIECVKQWIYGLVGGGPADSGGAG